jgi:hypothetical protein
MWDEVLRAGWLPVRLPAVAGQRHALRLAPAEHVDGRWPLLVGLAGGGDDDVPAGAVCVDAEHLAR